MSLDDFPTRDDNAELATRAENAFEQAVGGLGLFVVQGRDRQDYGTDFQLEAKHAGGMTNYRVHVQLKGTTKDANRDGSVSIAIARKNLNYLLSQQNSIFVCYHEPSRSLMVRSADDVFRDAEHKGEEWRGQATLNVRFGTRFDAEYQVQLHARTLAGSASLRDDRLHWIATIPEHFPDAVLKNVPSITVPESPADAFTVLKSLYEQGQEEVISKAFDQFAACFKPNSPMLIYAFLSEINLAMRHKNFDRERVGRGILLIESSRPDNGADALYCRANGHSALQEGEVAKRLYREAIRLSSDDNPHLAAQAWKNLGTEIEREGDQSEACHCYESALRLEPQLMEAHMALAQAYCKTGEMDAALPHLDSVIWSGDSETAIVARGHRVEAYFRLEKTTEAFDDIITILPQGRLRPWILPWCARLVYNYARTNEDSIARAIRFWDVFLKLEPNDLGARKERLLCLAHAKMHGQPVDIGYDRFVADVTALIDKNTVDAAHLWDRCGHWAQVDGDWPNAEVHYRQAYTLEPERYGYCLGTALNFLKRFDESLPILLEQANVHQPTAQSWFQVAVAQEGLGDFDGCIASYKRALDLDEDDAASMFNLGGTLWNHRSKSEAIALWSEALRRFPSHPVAERLRRELPHFFDNDDLRS